MNYFSEKNLQRYGDWAYTLIIPAGCKIGNRRYRELEYGEQAALLQRIIDSAGLEKYTLFHEKHKDGRLHVHGTFFDTFETLMHTHQMAVNLQLGYKLDSNKIFYYREKITEGWEAYCRKEQEEIARCNRDADHAMICKINGTCLEPDYNDSDTEENNISIDVFNFNHDEEIRSIKCK